MFSSLKLIKNLKSNGFIIQNILRNKATIALHYEKDPGAIFMNPEVQKILKNITNPSIQVVFKSRTVPDNSVSYKFMTTEELEDEYRNIVDKSQHLLQMPPVVKIQENASRVISKDPALKGFDNSKFVITDISYGLKLSDRKVIVREMDGTLEYASQDIGKRAIQSYIPANGRKLREPKIFSEAQRFRDCLAQGNYEFLLDLLCVQYEPYEKEYHELTAKVYTEISEQKGFNALRSTRHFGPMAFFLAWHKNIDDLLCDMISRDLLIDAIDLINLTSKIHKIEFDESIYKQFPKSQEISDKLFQELRKSVTTRQELKDANEQIKSVIGKTIEELDYDAVKLTFIENYVKTKCVKKIQLNAAIETLKEEYNEKRMLLNSINKREAVAASV